MSVFVPVPRSGAVMETQTLTVLSPDSHPHSLKTVNVCGAVGFALSEKLAIGVAEILRYWNWAYAGVAITSINTTPPTIEVA